MQAVRAKVATVTTRLIRMILLRVADRCMLQTSLKTSRFSLISCTGLATPVSEALAVAALEQVTSHGVGSAHPQAGEIRTK